MLMVFGGDSVLTEGVKLELHLLTHSKALDDMCLTTVYQISVKFTVGCHVHLP